MVFWKSRKDWFRENNMKAPYFSTNESLDSVMKGLDIQEGDRVFSICCSADFTFAAAEVADHVLASDYKENAICFGEDRRRFLQEGKLDLFSYFGAYERRNSGYFNEERCRAIRANSGNIKFEVEDVFEGRMGSEFNKIHLSNVCTFVGSPVGEQFDKWVNEAFLDSPDGALVYMAYPLRKRERPGCLELEENLTRVARKWKGEMWNPAVYRKVR
ncbi:hypothetical protein HNV12_00480 [Methanococcoides sp. SA1]|nr:hypothetical protein [Methanococcoides sp. SA1]